MISVFGGLLPKFSKSPSVPLPVYVITTGALWTEYHCSWRTFELVHFGLDKFPLLTSAPSYSLVLIIPQGPNQSYLSMVDQSAHWPSSAHAFHELLKLNETDNFSDAISNYELRLHVLAFAVSHIMFAPSFHSCYAIHPIIFASHPFMSFMSFTLFLSSFFLILYNSDTGPTSFPGLPRSSGNVPLMSPL